MDFVVSAQSNDNSAIRLPLYPTLRGGQGEINNIKRGIQIANLNPQKERSPGRGDLFVEILVGLKPSIAISDLARDIKAGSSNFINDNRWVSGKFNWQEGFGALSYSRSHIDAVIKYILHQEEHHRKKTFKEEYLESLKKYEVKYDEKYLFEWIE